MSPIKNIKEITEPLKEEILNGIIYTIDEMMVRLQPLGYSETINEAAIKSTSRVNPGMIGSRLAKIQDKIFDMSKMEGNLSRFAAMQTQQTDGRLSSTGSVRGGKPLSLLALP